MSDEPRFHTWIGSSTPDSITIGGLDLPSEVMGHLTLTELAYLLVTRRRPTDGPAPAVRRRAGGPGRPRPDALALATRLTHTGAPEAVQASVAAGLLGAGSVFLGPTGDTAEFLAAVLDGQPDDADLAALADAAVAERRAAGLRVPGLGHPVHRVEDPRTPRLYELAEQEGLLGPHLRLLTEVAAANERQSGKALPINGAGAAGAALADLDLPPDVIRGVVLIGRTAGLVAHIAEENQDPIGMPLWLEVEGRG